MNCIFSLHKDVAIACAALFFVLLPLCAGAQTLTINNSIQTYTTLTSATATMTGTSELHVTGTGSPMTGCVINLNSADSFFFMENVRPAVVTSTYLGSVQVNG